MNKKAILLIILCLVGAFAVTLYILNPTGFVERARSLWASILALPTTISNFIANPTGSLGTIGIAGTATTAAIGLYSKLKTRTQEAKQTISNVSGELSTVKTEYSQLKTDFTNLKTASTEKITELEGEKLALQTEATRLQGELEKQKAEVQTGITQVNTASDVAARAVAMQVPCPSCNQSILPGQRFCSKCGKELIIR